MNVYELRDAEDARHVLLQGYLLQRLRPPQAGGLIAALDLALDLAGAGVPIPPLGVLADLSNLLLRPHGAALSEHISAPGWSEHRALAYEDHVLGKWLADSSLDRAGDALRQYQESDRSRGLVFVLTQLRTRCGLGGVLMSPAFIKKLRDQAPEQTLTAAWDSLEQYGMLPTLLSLYDDLEKQVRLATAMLGPDDIFELENRTALAEFSQRVALRQVLQAAAALRESVPNRPRTSAISPREVPTHLRDEDAYPVGGFTSLSNRGTVESLLQSQLAFMEVDSAERPDLFDIKFLRDELLYYSRDDNQFFRRRRTFVFVLFTDLIQARVKSPASAWQQIVFLLGLVVALTDRLCEWLGNDALFFDVLFAHDNDALAPLESERSVLETIFRKQIASETVRIGDVDDRQLSTLCAAHARRSVVDCLLLSMHKADVRLDKVHVSSVRCAPPGLTVECDATLQDAEDGPALDQWRSALRNLLNLWIRR